MTLLHEEYGELFTEPIPDLGTTIQSFLGMVHERNRWIENGLSEFSSDIRNWDDTIHLQAGIVLVDIRRRNRAEMKQVFLTALSQKRAEESSHKSDDVNPDEGYRWLQFYLLPKYQRLMRLTLQTALSRGSSFLKKRP